jgi:hypothetical protein
MFVERIILYSLRYIFMTLEKQCFIHSHNSAKSILVLVSLFVGTRNWKKNKAICLRCWCINQSKSYNPVCLFKFIHYMFACGLNVYVFPKSIH